MRERANRIANYVSWVQAGSQLIALGPVPTVTSLIYLKKPRKTETRYLVSYIEMDFGPSSI
jgi:hypothetical protein